MLGFCYFPRTKQLGQGQGSQTLLCDGDGSVCSYWPPLCWAPLLGRYLWGGGLMAGAGDLELFLLLLGFLVPGYKF